MATPKRDPDTRDSARLRNRTPVTPSVRRAEAMMGDKAGARKLYQDFLTLWQDADPDVAIYWQVKVEYAPMG